MRAYEFWVIQTQGLEYRQAVIERWRRADRGIVEAESVARSWRLLGLRVLLSPDWLLP